MSTLCASCAAASPTAPVYVQFVDGSITRVPQVLINQSSLLKALAPEILPLQGSSQARPQPIIIPLDMTRYGLNDSLQAKRAIPALGLPANWHACDVHSLLVPTCEIPPQLYSLFTANGRFVSARVADRLQPLQPHEVNLTKPKTLKELQRGMSVYAKDYIDRWYLAQVLSVKDHTIGVHFVNFEHTQDEILPLSPKYLRLFDSLKF